MARKRVEVEYNGDEFLRELDASLGDATLAMANVAVNQTKKNLGRRGSTEKQKRAGDRSALDEVREFGDVDPPGGFPRLRTGNLRRSVFAEKNGDGVSSRLGVGAEYAAIHEFGGTIDQKNATINIPKRPYVRPALKKTESLQLRAFVAVLKQRLGLGDGP